MLCTSLHLPRSLIDRKSRFNALQLSVPCSIYKLQNLVSLRSGIRLSSIMPPKPKLTKDRDRLTQKVCIFVVYAFLDNNNDQFSIFLQHVTISRLDRTREATFFQCSYTSSTGNVESSKQCNRESWFHPATNLCFCGWQRAGSGFLCPAQRIRKLEGLKTRLSRLVAPRKRDLGLEGRCFDEASVPEYQEKIIASPIISTLQFLIDTIV